MGTQSKIKITDTGEIEKSKTHATLDFAGYIPNAVSCKVILRKVTGSISAMSFAPGKVLAEKTSPFDIFLQIIDGAAEIIIDEKSYQLKAGESIIIPAHAAHCFNAKKQFKLISTVIKSGYE